MSGLPEGEGCGREGPLRPLCEGGCVALSKVGRPGSIGTLPPSLRSLELHQQATDQGIPGRSKMNRDQLLDTLTRTGR